MKWEYIQPVTIRFGEGIVKEVKDVAACPWDAKENPGK